MPCNGPAVSVSKRRWVDQRASAGSFVFVTEFYQPVGSEAWRNFCRHGTILIAWWRNRGTKFLATSNLSWCRIWFEAGCAAIAVQICHGARTLSWYTDFTSGQMRVSGCPGHDKLSRKQEQFAKIVTSLLTLPSVLWLVYYFFVFEENPLLDNQVVVKWLF
jgi:hypothetical protein